MTEKTRRESMAAAGSAFYILQSGWGWDWFPWSEEEELDEETTSSDGSSGQRIYVTDDPNEDPTTEDGDVVFYV